MSAPFSQTRFAEREDLQHAREVVEHLKGLCQTIHVVGLQRALADNDDAAIAAAWQTNVPPEALALELTTTPVELIRMRYAIADLNFFIESGTFRSVITNGMDIALLSIVDVTLPAPTTS